MMSPRGRGHLFDALLGAISILAGLVLVAFAIALAVQEVYGADLIAGFPPRLIRIESGIASVYSRPQALSCGGRLDVRALTAAHRTLPCGIRVLVTNKANDKVVRVQINDRGPFVAGRIIDLTPAGARVLGFSGLTRVEVEATVAP